MGAPKLTLYFDLHSPYSYLAFYIIKVSMRQTVTRFRGLESETFGGDG
jgi:2-hydroxychromene-2-carboxylate isomerase